MTKDNSNRANSSAVLFTLILLSCLRLASAGEISLTMSPSATSVESGESFTYSLNYSCSGDTCRDVTITDQLPDVLNWAALTENPPNGGVQLTAPDGVAKSYDPNTGTVTFDFGPELAAGTTGVATIQVSFPNGSTPDGTISSNTAVMTSSDSGRVDATADDVTAIAASDWTIDKALEFTDPAPALDQTVLYRITLSSAAQTGGLDITDVLVTDSMPAGAQFVYASNNGTESGGTVTWDLGALAAGTSTTLTLALRYPSSTFSLSSSVTNTVALDATPVGEAAVNLPDQLVHGFVSPTGQIGTFTKIPSRTKGAYGDTISYRMEFTNTGNLAFETFVVEDPVPTEVAVNSIRIGAQDPGSTPFGQPCPVPGREDEFGIAQKLEYQSDNGGIWFPAPGSPFCTGSSLDLDPTDFLDPGDTISALRWTFEAVPVGFSMLENDTAIGFSSVLLETGRDGNPVVIGSSVDNNVAATASFDGLADLTKTGGARTTVQAKLAWVQVKKTVRSGSTVAPQGIVEYTFTIENVSDATGSLSEPVAADLLDPGLEYDEATGWRKDFENTGADLPNFSAIDNYNNTGRQLLRWSWEGLDNAEFPKGSSYRIRYGVRVKTGTLAGPIANEVSLVAPPIEDYIPRNSNVITQDIYDLNGNGDTTDLVSTTPPVDITVLASPELTSRKSVLGQLDDGYVSAPDAGLTVDGGTLSYLVTVTNTGNVPVTDLVMVDIIPHPGDTGVVSLGERNSAWRPRLIAPIDAPAGVTVLYSTAENPCRGDMNANAPDPDADWPNVSDGAPTDCIDAQWSAVPPTDITSVKSLRFEFNAIVIEPLDALQFSGPMQAPLRTDQTNGELASNSFGFYATRVDDSTLLLPSEPQAVDIALNAPEPPSYGDRVWLDTNKNGIQDPGEQGLNGVRVELHQYRGSGDADPALDALVGFRLSAEDGAAQPGIYQFTDLEPGQYYARFIRPAGYEITAKNAIGSTAENDSDADPDTGITAVTTIAAGEDDFSWDMGVFLSDNASVGDYVWFDRNGDGIQDEGVLDGINGVTVQLFNNSDPNNPVAAGTTTTADDINGNPGYYKFEELTPTTPYFVRFLLPAGATFTEPYQGGNSATDSDADPTTGDTAEFELASGEYDSSLDAGMQLQSGALSLGDRVWIDSNDNGIYEPLDGEAGVDTLRLNLYRDTGTVSGTFDADDTYYTATRTYTSDGAGYYRFADLPDGDWIVQVDAAAFAVGGLLEGLSPSNGSGQPPPDPNNDLDDDIDQNGYAEPSGDGVVSFAINLTDDNPTLDFAFVALAGGIELTPASDASSICGSHSVTAVVTDGQGAAMPDQTIDFSIISGPNAGESASEVSDENGEALFTWTSNGAPGTDVVSAGVEGTSVTGQATQSWADASVPRCDSVENGQIDIADVRDILAHRGAASGACDPRDTNANGVIGIDDARNCLLRCTNPRCAP